MYSITYKQAVKHARALRDMGVKSIYLDKGDPDIPWDRVCRVSPGGSHRLEISTTVRFEAYDKKSKLTFSWCFEIESHDANGSSHYKIVPEIEVTKVLLKMSTAGRTAFKAYLADCAAKVQAKALEFLAIGERQRLDAKKLYVLSKI